jgi:uncharacterized membrane protein (UPF0182 family)
VTVNSSRTNDLTKQDIATHGNDPEHSINDFESGENLLQSDPAIRLYYLFNDVDVDRYMVNGIYPGLPVRQKM